jgi:cyanophycin synthetase
MAGTIALGDAWDWTAERLPPSLLAVLDTKLPGSRQSGHVLDVPGLVAEIAQRIQLLGDIASQVCGVASRNPSERSAVVFFSCFDFVLAGHSLSLAVQLVDRMVQPDLTAERLAQLIQLCIDKAKQVCLEPSTLDMTQAAVRDGIPWVRLSPLSRHVQLGHGHRQQRLWMTMFSNEPVMAHDYARNKLLAWNLLAQVRLPVGRYAAVNDLAGVRRAAQEIGYPLVLKPLQGSHGDSVYVDLRNDAELMAAAKAARIQERPYVLQSFFAGNDHRLLVVSGKLVAAVRKDLATVTGDGRHTIAELVEIENRNPVRVAGRVAAPIPLNDESDRMLARQNCTRETVLASGRPVRVNGTANSGSGGIGMDVMDVIHPDNARAAVRAAKAIGTHIAGVDFVSPDISRSWRDVGGGICEINTTVGLRPHLQATPGFDVRRLLLRTLYPDGGDGRIPTAMVTGTTGKTSTSTMLASILASAGHVVGSATTEGVRIDGELVEQGDLASADGASIVLRDATVTAAVLETARGGIVKTGLYVDRCDVAALLNIQRDHIGIEGVETLDDMVAVKRKVLDVARKAVVLNADDLRCLALAHEFGPRLKVILFSCRADAPAIRDHAASGGDALFLAKYHGRETIVLASGMNEVPLLATDDVPATKEGLIWFHGINAMAAAALAIALGIGHDAIRSGLRRYGREYPAATLRSVFAEGFPMRVLFDSSGKAPAYAATVTVTDKIAVAGRKICVFTVPGNRPDWAFAESAEAVAGHFQRYICFERTEYRRGRKPGEIASRLADALIAAGIAPDAVSTAGDHGDVAGFLAREAKDDDFIVVFGTDSLATVENYRQAFREMRKPS